MKKRNKYIILVLALAIGLITAIVVAAPVWNTGTLEEQVQRLNDIQPGLGTVMIEYSNRFTNMYYAAKGANWDLAAYMFKEMLEIQEVGETTRPARAPALITFEDTFLAPINDAIAAQDFKQFNTAFQAAIEGCNGCHAGQGFPFIKYVLPKAPPMPLQWKLAKGHKGPPSPPNGAALYAANCAGCHGPLASSTKKGRTAEQITTAINTVPEMAGLKNLTSEQIAAIADALAQ